MNPRTNLHSSSQGVAKKYVAYAVGVLLGIACVLAYRFFTRPESVESVAEKTLAAALSGETDTVFRYESPKEKAINLPTKETLRGIYTRVLGPALVGYRKVGPPRIRTYADGVEALAIQPLVSADGRRSEFAVEAWKTDDGPRVTMSQIISAGFAVSALGNHPTFVPETYKHDMEASYASATPKLLGLGFHTSVRMNPASSGGYDIRELR